MTDFDYALHRQGKSRCRICGKVFDSAYGGSYWFVLAADGKAPPHLHTITDTDGNELHRCERPLDEIELVLLADIITEHGGDFVPSKDPKAPPMNPRHEALLRAELDRRRVLADREEARIAAER